MATYTVQHLKRIIGFLPRRPVIAPYTFNRLKELSIFRPYRGKGSKHSTFGNIPVVTSNRLISQNSNSNNSIHNINNRNLISLSKFQKKTEVPVLSCGVLNCRSINNKTSFIQDTILDCKLDCAALTETWLSDNEENNRVTISSLLPDN